MGLTLIIAGLLISYFCWSQKRKIDYFEKQYREEKTVTENMTDTRSKIQTKLQNNEKLTLSEKLNRYSNKITYIALYCGFYGGFVLSFIGLALFISMIFHFTFR